MFKKFTLDSLISQYAVLFKRTSIRRTLGKIKFVLFYCKQMASAFKIDIRSSEIFI